MRIKILEFVNGETMFATSIGSGLGVLTTPTHTGEELNVEFAIKGNLIWGIDIDFAAEAVASISIHDDQTQIVAHVESIDELGILDLRLHESGMLAVVVEGLPEDFPVGTWVKLQTDYLELYPFTL
jgi:hypothetical protein